MEMDKRRLIRAVIGLVLLIVLVSFLAVRNHKLLSAEKRKNEDAFEKRVAAASAQTEDVALIKGLLRENLSDRVFDFPVVVEASSGRRVLPLEGMRSRERISAAIAEAIEVVIEQMNGADSPVSGLRRINEASGYFEDALLEVLNAVDGISCTIPETREGKKQRSGYPDLRIVDEETGEIYYLDPKLMEQGSVDSSFRTFYFEPKRGTLKITDDAVHLLIGIEHDGVNGNWTFMGWRLIDLSGLKVRLKAEFQASNRDVYSGIVVDESGSAAVESEED